MFYIETPRLVIHPIKKNDFPFFLELVQNPKVMEFIGSGIKSEKEAIQLFQRFLDHQYRKGFSLGTVRNRQTQDYLGIGGVIHYELNTGRPDIEVGYWLHPQFWNRGYATEITIACVNWAFSHLSIQHIFGAAHPNNHASQRVLQKAGFIPCGTSTYNQRNVCLFKRLAPEPVMLYLDPPKDFRPVVEVSACYLMVNTELLLLKRAYDREGGLFGVPAGKINPGESPLNCVIRELFEETGLLFPSDYFRCLGKRFIRKPSIDYVYHMFTLEIRSKPELIINDEHLEYVWSTPQNALNLPLMAGAKQALSAAGICHEDH